jgi:RimJ/RimL family protein N-acetyltransferase
MKALILAMARCPWLAPFNETQFQCLTKFTDMAPDTFETARLRLRPVTVADVDAIFDSYVQDEEVVRYLT